MSRTNYNAAEHEDMIPFNVMFSIHLASTCTL